MLNLGFWKPKIVKSAKIWNLGFWKVKILKSAEILNFRILQSSSFEVNKNLEIKTLEA